VPLRRQALLTVLDYDEAYFHNTGGGFDRDMRKVDRGDAREGAACIVKFRRGLKALGHAPDKLLQPACESTNLVLQVRATFDATRGTIAPSPSTHPPTKASPAACKKAARPAWDKIDKLTEPTTSTLKPIFKSHWSPVYNTHGIKKRLWLGGLAPSLKWLVQAFGPGGAPITLTVHIWDNQVLYLLGGRWLTTIR
jgi:hypothetical protein